MFVYNVIKRSQMEAVNLRINAGQSVEIIYVDGSGSITQRKIAVRGVRDGIIQATDLASKQPRTFKVANILAWMPFEQLTKKTSA